MRTWLLACLLALPVSAQALTWDGVRDASLYLTPSRADTLRIAWRPAWQARANAEQLYLLDGRGRLVAQQDIAADQPRGELSWPITPGQGPYRLEVPGYSFRRYQISHDDSTVAQLAPAKVHFSLDTRSAPVWYTQVAAGQQAVLGGKYHGGARAVLAERLSDGRSLRLWLNTYPRYWQFDQAPLPTSTRDETWRLTVIGQGKTAFWLDGSDNLFAQTPEAAATRAQPPAPADGEVNLTWRGTVLGHTPDLGVALPYEPLPPVAHAAIDALAPTAGGFYSLVDIMAERPHYEDRWRDLYLKRFGIRHDITLLAARGRVAELSADRTTLAGLDAWLAATRARGGGGLHYLAFADEPNLNYRSFEAFEAYFQTLAEHVQQSPGARDAGVRIVMPASSRLLDGPFVEQARTRRGIDWARRLLAAHEARIDALAWHEWMVRDLLATRRYRDSVQQAADLVGRDAQGRPRKALLLDQTNISSGASLSPYDQNTQYAALWWTSVVINASADGLLDMLNWFHLADEPGWPKGMLAVRSPAGVSLKPVGQVQQFIARHWLDQVMALDNDAFEVDALAMARDQQRTVLGVNKAERLQRISLAALGCPAARLALFGADAQVREVTPRCENDRLRFELPAQTVFALSWSAP
ncbi:hypothetical protein ACQKO6_13700 [Pseudomonas monteilii]